MKKLLIPLFVLALVFTCVSAFADGDTAVTIELNKDKYPVYAADDPLLEGLVTVEEEPLQSILDFSEPEPAKPDEVIVLRLKQSLKLKPTIGPKSLKNKKFTISVGDEEAGIVKVKGNTITGTAVGETILTIASNADPTVKLEYRVLVIQPVKKLALTASDKNVVIGKTVNLAAEYTPEDASIKDVTWKSGNEKVATVDENGVVTGVKRGEVKISAVAKDGGNAKASVNLKVVQLAESITLNKTEVNLNTGKSTTLKATVLPKNTDNKKVTWASSDESIAKVNNQGRVTAVKAGTCEITCTSNSDESIIATAAVTVHQLVRSVKFDEAPVIYVGESGQLSWLVEPADATNPKVRLVSGNEKILMVNDDGRITGVKAGETYVTAIATDGSNHRAKVKVVVMQHLTGVKMRKNTAYINVRDSEVLSAVLEPSKYVNTNMTWTSSDPTVASVKAEKNTSKVRVTGLKAGSAVLVGTAEDGGLQTTMRIEVGNWNNALKITNAYLDGAGVPHIEVQNNSDLNITNIKLEIEAYTSYGDPVEINSKDFSHIIEADYGHTVRPGKSTPDYEWKLVNYNYNHLGFHRMIIRVVSYQIDNDWVMEIKDNYQPSYMYTHND